MKKVKRKSNRARGSLDDWMILPEYEMEKPLKERRYTLLPERRDIIVQWARNGLTRDEIAQNMNISRSTLAEWMKKCPDIADALKEARAYAHARVENALFRKAVGFSYIKQQPVKIKVKDRDESGKVLGTHEETEIIELEEYVPPDMGAIAFYLKNNIPARYKDKWTNAGDEEGQEAAENICMKEFTQAVAKAVIKERADGG